MRRSALQPTFFNTRAWVRSVAVTGRSLDAGTVATAAVAVQGQELHLEGFAVTVNVHDRADVPALQATIPKVLREYDPVMFCEHFVSSTDRR